MVPEAALEPNSERPKRAPSSSAQLTSRTVTGGIPSSAIRRRTSTPATTLREPSSQPPFGTESMWPPSTSVLSEAPRSVNHWFPASSTSSSAPIGATLPESQLFAATHVSVQATRWAPSSSPVSSRSSRSSSTVRLGSSGTEGMYRVSSLMGRGSRPLKRWRNDRTRKKKEREKRHAAEVGASRGKTKPAK